MTNNGAVESFEIERKYEVADDAVLPQAQVFQAIGLRADAPEAHELRASYFDTPEGGLAGRRLALRQRAGGKDEGWHLKAKGEAGARELLWPPSPEMPPGLRREVETNIGREALERLAEIATLQTQRVTTLLFDRTDTAVVEISDDRVEAVNRLNGRTQRWREWEAELMPGADEALLEHVEPLLVAAGAVRVRGTSKIQKTMQAEGETT